MAESLTVDISVTPLNSIDRYVKINSLAQISARKQNKSESCIWISGKPGSGKSDKLYQMCEELGWGLKIFYMSTAPLEQMSGLPVSENKTTDSDGSVIFPWSKPDIFDFSKMDLQCISEDGVTILLIDDAHCIDKNFQKYLFQLLTYGSINSHRLPPNTAIIFAGNRPEDNAGFQQILSAIVNRLWFINIDTSFDEWMNNFAIKNNVNMDVVSFLSKYSENIFSEPLESKAWASPRSWTYAAQMYTLFQIKNNKITKEELITIFAGHIGIEYATNFYKYQTMLLKWEAEKVLDGTIDFNELDIEDAMDCYTFLTAVAIDILKVFSDNKWRVTKSIKSKMEIFTDILRVIIHKETKIVPTVLRLMMLRCAKETGSVNKIIELIPKESVSTLTKII